ncbi:hypothetical protein T310_7778, partial [Rasamsonia emersonii CBS 393.64]
DYLNWVPKPLYLGRSEYRSRICEQFSPSSLGLCRFNGVSWVSQVIRSPSQGDSLTQTQTDLYSLHLPCRRHSLYNWFLQEPAQFCQRALQRIHIQPG